MSGPAHARLMARTYSTGSFARIVDAGGDPGFMNLGYAPDPTRPATSVQRQRNLVRLLVDAVAPQPGQALLDVGCGKGGLANLLSKVAPGAKVVGVHRDLHQLELAKPLRWRTVSFVAASAERLPFSSGSFDTVTAVEVLSHIGQKAQLAAEFARVLRPGGRAIVAYIALNRPYPEFTPAQRAHLQRVAALFCESPQDIPTRESACRVFGSAGLRLARHADLSDRVFAPRHAEFLALLRGLTHRNPAMRAAFTACAVWRWDVRPREFIRFLRVNTAAHPCRFYEYHVMELINDTCPEGGT